MYASMRSQDLWLGFCYDIFTATFMQELLVGWLGEDEPEESGEIEELSDLRWPRRPGLSTATLPGSLASPADFRLFRSMGRADQGLPGDAWPNRLRTYWQKSACGS